MTSESNSSLPKLLGLFNVREAQHLYSDNTKCKFRSGSSPDRERILALGPAQYTVQGVPGALSFGVKLPGREAEHLPPSSAEVKNAWSYTSTHRYVFMA
jgi:hypothetical protein